MSTLPRARTRPVRATRTALDGAVRAVHSGLATVRDATTALAYGVRDAHRMYFPVVATGTRTPADKGLPVCDLEVVTSRDHVRLRGWLVPGRGPHTVVVAHGMSRDKSMAIDHIRLLHDAGHHVVAIDMRNHGHSGRRLVWWHMADRFTRDLADVLHVVRRHPRLRGGRVAVLAFCFSTWPAVHLLSHTDATVDALICDSGPMADIGAGMAHIGGLRRASLPEPLQRRRIFACYRSAFRFASERMLMVDGWPPEPTAVHPPMLFIAGGIDPVMPPGAVLPVAGRFRASERWVAPNSQHMNAVRLDRQDYRERVTDFLDRAFAGTPAAAAARELDRG